MENHSGCVPLIAAAIIVAVMVVIGRGITSESNRVRQLEAQAQIAQANAAQAQADAQRMATFPLAVASLKDSALVVWYAARDSGKELLYIVIIAILAWRLSVRKEERPIEQRTTPPTKETFVDGGI